MKHLLSIAIIISFHQFGFAQELGVDTIRWNVTEFTDLNTDSKVQNEAYFVSVGNQSIKWVQQSGAHTVEFKVTGIDGELADTKSTGARLFRISDGQASGTIKFLKTESGESSIELHIKGSTSDIDLRYKISSHVKL
jgi:hypothetical protein